MAEANAACVRAATRTAMRGWRVALATLDDLQTRSFVPDQICYSAAVAACAGAGRWLEGLALLQCMQNDKVEANERTYGAAISGCEKARQWPMALALLTEAQEQRKANSYCYNAAISACEKGGQWITALDLLQQMQSKSSERDVFSFSSAASACEKGGAWSAALQLHVRMQEDGVERNVISFGSHLAACVAGHQWGKALHLLSAMNGCRVTPNLISYNAAMNACERGARGDLALLLLEDVQHTLKTLEPDATFYGVALSACRRGSHWQNALHLAELCPEVVAGIFTMQACERGFQSIATVSFASTLRQRVAGPAELYQAFNGIDELDKHSFLDMRTFMAVASRYYPPLRRLMNLAGGRSSRGSTWRLQEPLLEEQPTLGWVFTMEALKHLNLLPIDGTLRSLGHLGHARLNVRRLLGATDVPEEVGSQAITVWLAFQVRTTGLCHESMNRCVAFGAAWDTMSTAPSDLEQRLVPVLREHDRSQHAERKALLAVAASLGEDADCASGRVILYASHTLCISCLAVCCQFRGLFPGVSLHVHMDLWSETERWVRKGEQEAVSSIQRDAEVVFNFHSLHIKQ
ncbi:unnamed protein product [Cladocopium goreaui]|uniref:Pentatricopeptide repeat-containing protein GUN1, chloroplastic (Pentatricopeptide repeat-containing protein At2g31400) (Protein GENOMES UNCOUPLED 1) n=1 Tax=Cladocopium goreaui TaxID=2562237 RepID=A0A9P1M5G7_9DINO|nr:unnamed protein product [Cladocopium goreaui]